MPVKHADDEARKKYNRETKAAYRKSPTGRLNKEIRERPFSGIDGEGGTDANGVHHYYLLRAGDNVLSTGRPLTTDECLAFIMTLSNRVIHVGYFFDYDVTMILKGMRVDRVQRLLDRHMRTRVDGKGKIFTMPLDYGEYQLDYLPGKEFKVRKRVGIKDGKRVYSPYVIINDVGAFFQQSFLKSLVDWDIGTAEERQTIEDGKAMRADFGKLTSDVVAYNALEIRLLNDLMEAFREVCRSAGYIPSRWQGPGNIAVKMLEKNGVKKTRDYTRQIPLPVALAANDAYYGGRFETTAIGSIPGKVFQYDIRSAYPAALLELPCLEHGEWSLTGNPETDLYLSHGTFEAKDSHKTHLPALYGLQIRDKNNAISCPQTGSGWYWSVEIKVAEVHQTYTSDQEWYYVKKCDCVPFHWVPEVFAERMRIGKGGKGKILKLGLNSIYGKTVQSIGAAPYANPVWGSLITALVRAKLNKACHKEDILGCRCNDVYMLATDAVFSKYRIKELDLSEDLGAWELDIHDGLFIVQPGLYFAGDKMPKTRGVPRAAVIAKEAEFRAVYDRFIEDGDLKKAVVRVPMTSFIGLRLAWHRKAYDTAGQWVVLKDPVTGEDGKGIRFEWRPKRDRFAIRDGTLVTLPAEGNYAESVPYSKDIGRALELAKLLGGLSEQPDWAGAAFYEEVIDGKG